MVVALLVGALTFPLALAAQAHPGTAAKAKQRCTTTRCHKRVALKRHFPYCQSWRCLKRAKLREYRRQLRRLTPYGKWAIPAYIVMCESHGNFRARNRVSSAGGAYQILDSTWIAYGGTPYRDSHPAAVAPPWEQHKIAARIWAGGRGKSQWMCA